MALFTNLDTQAGKPKFLRLGQIRGLSVTGVMSGYVNGASLTISAPETTVQNGGVQATGTIVVVGGVITGFNITNPGAGYVAVPTVTAPAGTGATITASIKKNKAGVSNGDIVFVSAEEAALSVNRLKGIKQPGWWKVTERLQSDGAIRYMSECLVAMTVANATSGDNAVVTEDVLAGDSALSITTQPADIQVTAPATAAFTIVAVGATGYQWQVQTGGVGAYANVAGGTGATTASYTTAATVTGNTGNKYRCVVTNAGSTIKTRGAKLTAV